MADREHERRRRAEEERNREAARAVAFLISSRKVEAGARDLLTGAVVRELATLCEEADRFERETLAPIDADREARRAPEMEALEAKEKAAREEPFDARNELAARWHAERRELWRKHNEPRREAIDGMAPLDAALVRRLRELADAAKVEEAAAKVEEAAAKVEEAAREAWARDVEEGLVYFTPWALAYPDVDQGPPPNWAQKWATTHKRGCGVVVPGGESWPPGAAFGPYVRVPRKPDPGWNLWVEAAGAVGLDPDPTESYGPARRDAFLDAINRYRSAVRAHVEEHPEDWEPPGRIVRLALALWEAGGVREKWRPRARSHVPTLHGTVLAMVTQGTREPGEDGSIIRRAARDELLAPVPAALHAVITGELTVNADVALVTAALVREVWSQWMRYADEPRVVTFDSGRAALRKAGLPDDVDRVERALNTLNGISVMNGDDKRAVSEPLVISHGRSNQHNPAGGRPAHVLVVHVGFALAPYALARVCIDRGLTLPKEMRLTSGVLALDHVPRVGDQRTAHATRAALALGLPAWLMERREEYAERGGLALGPADLKKWEAWSAPRFNLYVRTNHASLPERVLEAARTGDKGRGRDAPPLAAVSAEPWPGGPILAEVNGRWRMRDDGQHRLIVEAAETTREQRARRQRRKPKR